MSCTRNKNTPGNYKLERIQQDSIQQYRAAEHFATPEQTYLPGNGFLHSWIPNTQLAHNAVDIESNLRGIGSTNLVNPMPTFVPEPKVQNLQQMHLFKTQDIIMPDPLIIEKNQRPTF